MQKDWITAATNFKYHEHAQANPNETQGNIDQSETVIQ